MPSKYFCRRSGIDRLSSHNEFQSTVKKKLIGVVVVFLLGDATVMVSQEMPEPALPNLQDEIQMRRDMSIWSKK
jgi:hypothetical protein